MDDFRFPWEDEVDSRKGAAEESAAEPLTESAEGQAADSAAEPFTEPAKEGEKFSTAAAEGHNGDGNFAADGSQAKSGDAQDRNTEFHDSSTGYFQQDDLGTRRTSDDGAGKGYHSSYDAYRFHEPEDTRGTYHSGTQGGDYYDRGARSGGRNDQYGSWNGSAGQGNDRTGGQKYQNGGWNAQGDGQNYQNSSWNNSGNGWNRPGGGQNYGNGGQSYGGGGKKPKKNRNGGKKTGLVVLLVAVFAIVFGLVFAAASSFLRGGTSSGGDTAPASEYSASESSEDVVLGRDDSEEEGSEGEEETADADSRADSATASAAGELTTQQVVSKVMPSMVAITNVTVSEYQNFFGESETYENVSAGSGIIVGETEDDLLIATNNHVISGSSDITVTFVDEAAVAGSIKGTDADNDLAIVAVPISEISEDTLGAIAIVEIGDSDALQVGESVVAIGNALGYGQSVSKGIISALNRVVEDTDGTQRELIQTDASINPGNSGGALLNMQGQLIGINEAKYVDESVEGVGYAIPMAVAEPILTRLGSNTARTLVDEADASYIGISAQTMPSYYTASGYPEGVYVAEVTPGGPAEKAGIEEGDIITSVGGTAVTTSDELIELLRYYAAGEEVDVSVSRMKEDKSGFEKKKFTVTLGNRADMPSQTESTSQEEDSETSDGTRSGFPSAGDVYEYFFGDGEGDN